MLIDTHAHLDFPEFVDHLDAVLTHAARNGIRQIVSIGISLASSARAIEIAGCHAQVFATVGIHPHGARALSSETLEQMRSMAQHERVVAVGEIGLDYYRDRQPRNIQRQCFRQQLELARELQLPVVIHVRDAYEDCLTVIRDYAAAIPAVILHCFSGNWETAEKCLDLGCFLSIPGTVTFAKAQMQQDVARRIPLERLLLETDAPFLAPEPHRGKTNEPSYLLHTAQKISQLRQLPVEEVAHQTTINAAIVFGLGS
jgi:TatD DNase family protein